MHWQDDDGSDDYAVDDQIDDDPEDNQLPCPSCGHMVFDDTDRCPHCGDWIMPLAAAASGRQTWIWWTALVLAVVLMVAWGLFG